MNQLARNSQIMAARQRLAARQGGVPGGASAGNLAGCGLPVNQGGYPTFPAERGWTPYPFYEGLPEMAPGLPAQNLAGPGTTLRQHLAPCSAIVRVQEVGAPTVVELATRGGAAFYGNGIKTMNEAFQVIINSLETGSLEYDLIPCDGVDAAYWNTDECYCPMDIGCVTNVSPLTIEFSAFGTPSVLPFLNFVMVGTRDSGFQNCGYWPASYPYPLPAPPNGGGGRPPGGWGGPGNIAHPGNGRIPPVG